MDKNLEYWSHFLHVTLLCAWTKLLRQGDVCGFHRNVALSHARNNSSNPAEFKMQKLCYSITIVYKQSKVV